MNTSTSKPVVKVAVTGAAGQISYSLLFRIASGGFLPHANIELRLLEIPQAMNALEGVVMELRDCAFSHVHNIYGFSDPYQAFEDIDYAFLVGAKPRGPGMERGDLLQANAQIFSQQGKALQDVAKRSVRVLVVGNPANTNALITQSNAKNIPVEQFAAMTRLDHNRAIGLLAQKTQSSIHDIENITIWGNHSATQYPDVHHATIAGKAVLSVVDQTWYQQTYIAQVQQRGAAIINARGASSAASAASAAVDHMRDLAQANRWTSMAVRPATNPYGISTDVFYSFPLQTQAGNWQMHTGLSINDFSYERIRLTEKELIEERDAIRHLLP